MKRPVLLRTPRRALEQKSLPGMKANVRAAVSMTCKDSTTLVRAAKAARMEKREALLRQESMVKWSKSLGCQKSLVAWIQTR